jgi:hypothetical protein
VAENLHRWRASHVVVYGDSGATLDRSWSDAGFEALGIFDWGDWTEALRGHVLWRSALPPRWHLLRAPVGADTSKAGEHG